MAPAHRPTAVPSGVLNAEGKRERSNVPCCPDLTVEYPDGAVFVALPYWDEGGPHCHGCGTPLGGNHHFGRDVERCPRCGGQLTGCGCLAARGMRASNLHGVEAEGLLPPFQGTLEAVIGPLGVDLSGLDAAVPQVPRRVMQR